MDDLISRQAAIDAIEERIKANGYVNVALISELNRLYGYIRQLPSAQPDRKKGKWLEKKVVPVYENGFPLQLCKCSECDRCDTRPYMYYFSEPNFCSYCGAEMVKGESDDKRTVISCGSCCRFSRKQRLFDGARYANGFHVKA